MSSAQFWTPEHQLTLLTRIWWQCGTCRSIRKRLGIRIRTLANSIDPLGVADFKVNLFGREFPITAQVVNTRIFGGLLVGNPFMRATGIDILNSTGYVRFAEADGLSVPIRNLWDSPTVIRVSGIRNRKSCIKCCSDSSKELSEYACLCDRRSSHPVKNQTETTDRSKAGVTHSQSQLETQKQTQSEKSETRTRRSRDGKRETTTVTTVTVTTRWLPEEYGCNDSDLSSSDCNRNKVRETDPIRSHESIRSRSTNQFRSSERQKSKRRKRRRQHILRKQSASTSETEVTDSDTGLSQSPDMDTDICPLQVTAGETEYSAEDSEREAANVLFMPDEWEALGQDVKPDPLSDPVINKDLTEEEIRLISNLVVECNHIFSHGEYDVGAARTAPAVLDTGDHPPINSPNWRMKPAMNLELDRQIKALLKAGIIEPSLSPWNFPPVLVEKKSTKKFRLTINYQKLNSVLKKNAMIPPDIETILDRLGGMEFKSLVDARSGYFQLLLSPESREKTAFRGPYGLNQFTRLPQGLATAPAILPDSNESDARRSERHLCAGIHG